MPTILYQLRARVTRPDGLSSAHGAGLLTVHAVEQVLKTGTGKVSVTGTFEVEAPMVAISRRAVRLERTAVEIKDFAFRIQENRPSARVDVRGWFARSWGHIDKLEATIHPKGRLRKLAREMFAVGSGSIVAAEPDHKAAPVEPAPPGPGSDDKPVPPSLPTPDPRDAVDLTGCVYLGPHKGVKVERLPITRVLRGASIKGSTLVYDYAKTGWPARSAIGAGLALRCYIFWRRADGVLTGGHFEWADDGRSARLLKNIRDNYLDDQQPAKGAQIWACLVDSATSTERTNTVSAGVWP